MLAKTTTKQTQWIKLIKPWILEFNRNLELYLSTIEKGWLWKWQFSLIIRLSLDTQHVHSVVTYIWLNRDISRVYDYVHFQVSSSQIHLSAATKYNAFMQWKKLFLAVGRNVTIMHLTQIFFRLSLMWVFISWLLCL